MRGVFSESATDHTSFQMCYGPGLGLHGFCSSLCVQQSPEGSPQITQFKSARILLLFYIINMYVLLLKKSDLTSERPEEREWGLRTGPI